MGSDAWGGSNFSWQLRGGEASQQPPQKPPPSLDLGAHVAGAPHASIPPASAPHFMHSLCPHLPAINAPNPLKLYASAHPLNHNPSSSSLQSLSAGGSEQHTHHGFSVLSGQQQQQQHQEQQESNNWVQVCVCARICCACACVCI